MSIFCWSVSKPITVSPASWAARTSGDTAHAPGLELVVVVHRVAGRAPGLYRVDAEGQLAPQRLADLRRSLTRTCLGQDMAGTCAAAFFTVADLGVDVPGRAVPDREVRGDRRYRDLLIESGAVGQRIYLAAEATNLAARNLAAFRDDDLNALLGLDGRNRAALHLTLLGA